MFGISGVGKSRLVSDVAARIPGILHLQGSALIKQGLSDPSVSSEELRRSSGDRIIANQRILTAMFDRAVSKHTGSLVLFDGHLLIDTGPELIEVPPIIIAALHPVILVHVEAEPSLIVTHRQNDVSKKRPARDIETLAAQQTRSRNLCQACAHSQSIPMLVVRSGDVGGGSAPAGGVRAPS